MNYVMPESTMVIKSVKPQDVPEICQFVSANTTGLLRMQDTADTIPEFPSAKIIYSNFISSRHANRAVAMVLVECTRRGWGGGRTKAATKDKLSSIKRSPENMFPVYVTDLPSDNKQQQQLELQQLYSKYGTCWVAVNTTNTHAFINFDTFDSAMAALNDSRGIRYGDCILKAKTAFDTAWTQLVWTELKKNSKLSFASLCKMAEAGVRGESAKLYHPKSFLAPLRRVVHFQVSDAEQQVTWERSAENLDQARLRSQGVAQATLQVGPINRLNAWSPHQSAWSRQPSQVISIFSASPRRELQDEVARSASGASDEMSRPMASLGGNHQRDNDRKPAQKSQEEQGKEEQEDVGSEGFEETECGTPAKYVCPIGQHLMQDPVRLSNGKVYERCQIEKYLAQGKNVCPLTQVRIDPGCVIPDPALQAEIASYAQSQRVEVQGSQRSSSPHQSSLDLLPPSSTVPTQTKHGEGSEFSGETLALTNFNCAGSSIFKIVKRLGGGGMGDVYQAERMSVGPMAVVGEKGIETLALKICFPLRDGKQERNKQEAVNLRRLQEIKHENVIRMFGSGSSPNGSVVLVIEEISSQLTLKDMMDHWNASRVQASLAQFAGSGDTNNMGQPSIDLCMDVMGQMMCGMAAVHKHGLAHLDLKPSNVMLQPLTNKLRVVIIDFGLSQDTNDDHRVTGTDQLVGTTSYMSPEQLGGIFGPGTKYMAADVWALGVMAYTMIEGLHPFANATSVPPRNEAEKSRLILNIQSLQMPPLKLNPCQVRSGSMSRKLNPGPLLQRFLSVALDKNPDRRFCSAIPMERTFLGLKLGLRRGGRTEEMEQTLLDLMFHDVGSTSDHGKRSAGSSEGLSSIHESRAASGIKPKHWHPTAHSGPQDLTAKFSCRGTRARLSDATATEVSLLLRRLGGHFVSAARVVEDNGVGGEDLKEFLGDKGREHNPLYMSVEEGGLGLGKTQVRKLRRELQKLFTEEKTSRSQRGGLRVTRT